MFGPVINFLVKVVAPIAVTVVSAIVAQGNNFIANAVNTVAGWFGEGSNSGSNGSRSSGGSSSNRGASSVLNFEEQRRLAIQQRQQRQSLERDISYSLEQTEPDEERPLDFANLLPALVPAEIMLAASGNPVAESMVIMLRNERGLFEAMMNAAASPEEGLRNLFAEAGRSEEWDRQALDLLMRFRGDERPNNSGVVGSLPWGAGASGFGIFGVSRGIVTRAVISATMSSIFQQDGPTLSPTSQIEGFPLVMNLEEIPSAYIYRTARGVEESNSSITAARQAFINFLNPTNAQNASAITPSGQPPWWLEDNTVTIDEILAVIAFHEGKSEVGESVREAIYTRYMFYMGGSNFSGVTTSLDEDPNPNMVGLQNTGLDRLLRFLAYYQVWTQPEAVVSAQYDEDIRSRPEMEQARQFFSTQGMSLFNDQRVVNWDPDDPENDRNSDGIVDIDPFLNVFGDRPFHFANKSLDEYPQAIQDIILSALQDGVLIQSVVENLRETGQIYDIIPTQSGGYTVVMTPRQAARLCPVIIPGADQNDLSGINLGPDCQ